MIMLSIDNLTFASNSLLDPFGRVFFFQGRILRLIHNNASKYCLELLNSELFHVLVKGKYIPQTWICNDIKIQGYEIILEHEKCTVIKPHEWSFNMFKDATEFLLSLNIICNKFGYEVKDGHPMNITFHKGKPIFLDLGSIERKKGNEWIAKLEFLQTMYLPLLLWVKGEFFISRQILETTDMYIKRITPTSYPLDSPFLKKTLKGCYTYVIQRKSKQWTTKSSIIQQLVKISNYITTIIGKSNQFNIAVYYKTPSTKELKSFSKKTFHLHKETINSENEQSGIDFDVILQIIKSNCSNTQSFLEIGEHNHNFSLFIEANHYCSSVTTIDNNEERIDNGYLLRKKMGKNSDIALVNCMWPFDTNSTISRYKSDILYLCDVIKTLKHQHFPIEVIIQRLQAFTNKYIVIVNPGNLEDFMADSFPYISLYFRSLYMDKLNHNHYIYIGQKHVSKN